MEVFYIAYPTIIFIGITGYMLYFKMLPVQFITCWILLVKILLTFFFWLVMKSLYCLGMNDFIYLVLNGRIMKEDWRDLGKFFTLSLWFLICINVYSYKCSSEGLWNLCVFVFSGEKTRFNGYSKGELLASVMKQSFLFVCFVLETLQF